MRIKPLGFRRCTSIRPLENPDPKRLSQGLGLLCQEQFDQVEAVVPPLIHAASSVLERISFSEYSHVLEIKCSADLKVLATFLPHLKKPSKLYLSEGENRSYNKEDIAAFAIAANEHLNSFSLDFSRRVDTNNFSSPSQLLYDLIDPIDKIDHLNFGLCWFPDSGAIVQQITKKVSSLSLCDFPMNRRSLTVLASYLPTSNLKHLYISPSNYHLSERNCSEIADMTDKFPKTVLESVHLPLAEKVQYHGYWSETPRTETRQFTNRHGKRVTYDFYYY